MTELSKQVDELIASQLQSWPLAKANYEGLSTVKVKKIAFGDIDFFVQFNPKRIISSAAKVDAKSIQERKCFLCEANRPKEQASINFLDCYQILVNPFPIFPRHLTIPAKDHEPQEIDGKIGDMLSVAEALPDFVIFYNGPKCGASAPDHFHFQAGNKGFLPLEKSFSSMKKEAIFENDTSQFGLLSDYPINALYFQSESKDEMENMLYVYLEIPELPDGESEPMMNIVAWMEGGKYVVCVFPRRNHRPKCYFEEGDKNILLSPASVDMGGVFITPQEKDFDKISADDLRQIIEDVCVSDHDLKMLYNPLRFVLRMS